MSQKKNSIKNDKNVDIFSNKIQSDGKMTEYTKTLSKNAISLNKNCHQNIVIKKTNEKSPMRKK